MNPTSGPRTVNYYNQHENQGKVPEQKQIPRPTAPSSGSKPSWRIDFSAHIEEPSANYGLLEMQHYSSDHFNGRTSTKTYYYLRTDGNEIQ